MVKEFSITESARQGAAILRVTGRLDARNAQILLRTCRAHEEKGDRNLVINLSEVTFVASSGVGTLLALTEELADAGGTVHLVALSDPVKSVIELLNLTQFLNLGASEAEALEAIGA
ncbi:MAG: STAS domain-containing protein [bacterium]